jgi:lipopolysaccharide transport system ATP-binding protein
MSSDLAVRATGLGKCYQIYDKPRDRLKQTLLRGRRQFYREFWALHDVCLEVRRGEALGIIGRNGSGKSTLLQLLAGTLTPTTGTVQIDGRVAALLELGSGFNPEFTGRENVYMNGAILGIGRAEMARRFAAIESFADIGSFIDQPTKTYSSGMMVRLAFSVAINIDPDILLVDEALAVGDAAFHFKCLERLDTLARNGLTLVFVSHSMDMIKTFCNHVLYLEAGAVKASGAPDEMAELYLCDVRVEQQRSRDATSPVRWKEPLYSTGQSAFGTDDGRIVRAEFVDTNEQSADFGAGAEIAFVIDLEYKASVCRPSLSVLVQDRRMMLIGGRTFPLAGVRTGDDLVRARVQCSIPGSLTAGRFFVTLRLEERKSEELFFPIDKQIGVLSFEVFRRRRDALGAVDLAIQAIELPLGDAQALGRPEAISSPG